MLRSEGFTPTQAAGICGNIRSLNMYNTEKNEKKGTVGICNWNIATDGKKLLEFAEWIKADPYSIYTQAAFLISIMRQDGTEEKIKAETGTAKITDIYCITYEKSKSFSSKNEWKEAKNGIEW